MNFTIQVAEPRPMTDEETSDPIRLHEWELIGRLCRANGVVNVFDVERKSDRDYDVTIRGVRSNQNRFSAWLVLWAIETFTDWARDPVAAMADYPEMAKDGDWSGVRDTDERRLWSIFFLHALKA